MWFRQRLAAQVIEDETSAYRTQNTLSSRGQTVPLVYSDVNYASLLAAATGSRIHVMVLAVSL